MPEEAEVDTDKLQETIHEALEHEGGGRLLKQIALTTAILAALASVASLRAGATVNEALVLKSEAAQLQAQASDEWAYYQAKGVKAAVEEASRTSWLAMGKQPPPEYEAAMRRYQEEQKEIQAQAREKESERDQRDREADQLLRRHHAFATAVALLQVSIALGAVAALTRNRVVLLGSMVVGLAGAAVFAWKLLA